MENYGEMIKFLRGRATERRSFLHFDLRHVGGMMHQSTLEHQRLCVWINLSSFLEDHNAISRHKSVEKTLQPSVCFSIFKLFPFGSSGRCPQNFISVLCAPSRILIVWNDEDITKMPHSSDHNRETEVDILAILDFDSFQVNYTCVGCFCGFSPNIHIPLPVLTFLISPQASLRAFLCITPGDLTSPYRQESWFMSHLPLHDSVLRTAHNCRD